MPNEGWPQGPAFFSRGTGFHEKLYNHTVNSYIGRRPGTQKERMRGRAEMYRVINGTRSRNDYDFDARTIDALLALAATNHLNDAARRF